MDIIYTFALVLGVVFLFLFSIRKFSNQVSRVAGDKFKTTMETFTKTPWRGIALGAAVTAILQSSTATTVLLVGLVDAGTISFFNSLGVIFGANIGTTITSQLVAFNILKIAPYILIIGFFVDRTNSRWKKYGKSIFYFGLVFFCLALIAELIQPLSNDPRILTFFSSISNIFIAILVGVFLTVFFQSSTAVAGIVILLVAQGVLNFDQAFGIILGSNIGTTSTALIASSIMGKQARRTAVAHFLFNLVGVIIFLPFFDLFVSLIKLIDGSVAREVANAHLLFNLVNTVVFLAVLKPFSRLISRLVRDHKTAE
jgi:phosphate:Na+ symporter